jgi:hypothetical protein
MAKDAVTFLSAKNLGFIVGRQCHHCVFTFGPNKASLSGCACRVQPPGPEAIPAICQYTAAGRAGHF